jgi:hypothetical protein
MFLVHDGSNENIEEDEENVNIDWFSQSILQNTILDTSKFLL